MQPTQTDNRRPDGFLPKWRHFSPHDRIWLQNPFDHDVVFQVADEYNRPFKYRLGAHKVSELPGGAIATLGVKSIVDELIQNNKGDEMQMWNPVVRKKHEDSIILREKSTSPTGSITQAGEVDLTVAPNDMDATKQAQEASTAPEQAFPGLNQTLASEPVLTPLPAAAANGLGDLITASLPRTDAIVSPNSTHANAEG